MSKAKKIISMLLAVVMVLSVVPVSATAATVINTPSNVPDGVVYSTPEISNASDTYFTVDTTATTEVIRVAAGTGTFSLGDGTDAAQYTIVKATPSGIPENGGTYKHIAYAGETPEQPTVRFTITGRTPVEIPSIVASVTGISFGTVKEIKGSNSTTYEFPVNGSGSALVPHTDVVFTITFKLGAVEYKAYAYSHIENIIVMNGVINYHHVEKSGSDTARYSSIQQYQSHNMYTRMNGATYYVNQLVNGQYVETATADSGAKQVSNRTLGYINYATTTAASGNTLLGCGSENDVDGSINAYASSVPNGAIAGVEQAALIKGTTIKDGDYSNKCTDDDTNRGESIIYMDATDTLQSLNFRFTMQNAEASEFGNLKLDGFTFWAPGSGYSIGSDSSSITATNVATSVIGVQGLTYGSNGTATLTNKGTDFSDYVMAKFSGNGPRTDTDINSTYIIFSDVSSVKGDRNLNGYCGLNVVFRCYDTRDLRALYNGILKGDGSTYTCVTTKYSGVNVTFNKGVFPRKDMYDIPLEQWNTFENALKTAGSVLAQPDTSQAEIDAAAATLYDSYVALPTPYSVVEFEIKHLLENTDTPVSVLGKAVPSQTGTADMGSVMVSKAATIPGYTAVGTTTVTTDFSGKKAKETITFFYTPKNYNIRYIYNNPEYVDENGNVIAEDMIGYKYNTALDLDAIERGTREHYTFVGWYNNDYDPYDASFASQTKYNNGTSAKDFTVYNDINFYAIWKITPLNVNVTPVTNQGAVLTNHKGTLGSVQLTSESDTKGLANPGDYNIDGYFFGGYYESYDSATGTFSNPVSWPISFSFGDSDKEIYARMIDVNGRVSFNSNGGSDVSDLQFTAGDTISAPEAPTKQGYTFAGWYNEDGSYKYFDHDPANGWNNGSKTMTNNTGFLAYAHWTANQYTITFDMGAPTTDFDTTNNQMPTLIGYADSPIDPDDIPAEPTKFGKSFAQWVIKGTSTVFDFTTYPTQDIVLEPVWNNTKYSAFVSIGAYEKLAGEYVEVVNPTGANREGAAQKGDVVTFRMTSQTNFFTGSSVFVFMYDKNFFELVDSGTDAFKLNAENEYVKGIDASAIGVTNDTLMNRVWPTTDNMDRSTYNAMMVTIDPTVTTNNFNCEPMADGTWLVEFQLKVKDDATGSGTVYMHNDWTRTADNIMGTMFYGWAETKDASVAETFNNVVEPNLSKATATITIDETPQVVTELIADPNGGTWADGSTDPITYEGNAGTEIDGFVNPTREGYELTGWVKSDDASVTWNEGYYATEAQNEETFVAQWEPLKFTVNYYLEENGELWDSKELAYDSLIESPFYDVEKEGFDFVSWVNAATGETVTIGETTVPLGGIDIYATWTAAPVDYSIVINYYNNQQQKPATQSRTKQALAGSPVYIVESVDSPVEGATYVLWSELPAINGYEFDTANEANQALATTPTVVNADGSTVINVYYKAKIINITLNANEGAWTTGETEKVISGEFYTSTTEKVAAAGEPVREGYNFLGWHNSVGPVTRPSGVRATFNADATFYAQWEAKKVPVTFDANGGQFAGGATTSSSELAFGSTITAPTAPTQTGYNFLGWSTDGSTVITDLGTADSFDGKTFKAVWGIASYDVTYFVDGVEYSTANAEYNSTVTFAAYPEDILGYSFDGWYYNDTKYAPGQTITMPAGAISIDGEFKPDTFKATFNANGGYFDGDEAKTVVENDVVFGNGIATPSTPARNGYEFLGWAESADSNATVIPGTMDTEGKTYYAVWKATIWNYNVEFYYMDTEGNYGAAAEGETLEIQGIVGSEVSYNPAPKTGFAVDSASSTLSGTVTVDPVLVLKVYYSRNQHKVTWIENLNSTVYHEETLYYGEAIVPPTYNVEGYTWTETTPSIEATMGNEDQEYTMKITANKYDVIFNNAGAGLLNNASTATINASFNTLLNDVANNVTAVREGYELVGWSYTEGGAAIAADAKVPVGGTTLYAIWEIQSYTVNFRAGAGTFEATGSNLYTSTVTYGDEIVVPAAPVRTGYKFTGWSPAVPETMPAGNQNFNAQWALKSFNVKFVIDDTVIEETYNYGADIFAPDETQTVKEGWTFQYWTDASGNEVEIPEKMADIGADGTEVVYTAFFTIDSHNATWKNEDGSVYEGPVSYEYGAPVNKPAVDPSKTGWSFKGWKAADGTLYNAATAVPAMSTTDVEYTAYFEINQYTITFDADGGSAVAPITQNYATSVTKPADPQKTGYTFAGWLPAVPATMPAENVTVKAQWTINQYTITFDVDGGSAVDPITQDYNTAVTAPADPTKTGYTFKGWSPAVPATMPAENVTVKAQWSINSYTATFVSDGTTIESKSYTYGEGVVRPNNPTKTGHTFAGWLSDTGILYGVGMDVPAMGAANVTYTAQWDIDSFVVTWVNEDDSVYESASYEYGKPVSKPAVNPTKTGWTFKGWKAVDGTLYDENTAVPNMGTTNVTYKAYFVINQYVIVFDAADGAFADGKSTYTITADYDTLVSAPAKPSLEGYTFQYWVDKDGNEVEIPATWRVAPENINYTAVWKVNVYTVKFVDEAGEEYFTVDLDYGTVIASPETYEGYTANPALEHYTFEGWSLTKVELEQYKEAVEANVIDFATANITVPENGITIYPVFARVVVTLALHEGSTAIVEMDENAADPKIGYITGLETRLTQAKLLSTYLTVEGDGRLEVTLTKYKVCGTGAKVDVYDNLNDEAPVETYYIIIYGDVNGDAEADATDASIIGSESIGLTSWSNTRSEAYNVCMVKAGDLAEDDDHITPTDLTAIDDVALWIAAIDQQTGKLVYSA